MNNLNVDLFVLADYVSLSKENKLSINGIFDKFITQEIPTKWPAMYLAAVIKGLPGREYTIRMRIDSEYKKKMFDQEFKIKLGDNGKMNFITGLNNFPLEAYGRYQILLVANNDTIGELTFTVEKPDVLVSPKEEEVKLAN